MLLYFLSAEHQEEGREVILTASLQDSRDHAGHLHIISIDDHNPVWATGTDQVGGEAAVGGGRVKLCPQVQMGSWKGERVGRFA